MQMNDAIEDVTIESIEKGIKAKEKASKES